MFTLAVPFDPAGQAAGTLHGRLQARRTPHLPTNPCIVAKSLRCRMSLLDGIAGSIG